MDASRVKQIVDGNLERLVRELNIVGWKVEVLVGPNPDPRWGAYVDMTAGDYNQAFITIDPAKHDSDQAVMRSLVHELLHVVLSRMETYRRVVTTAMHPESIEGQMAQEVWTHAIEQAVWTLETGLARHLWEGYGENLRVRSPSQGEETLDRR